MRAMMHVDALRTLNDERPADKFDTRFLMTLLIGLSSIKKIIGNEAIEGGVLGLVKDIFQWRVMNDEKRMNDFQKLIADAINKIKNNNLA